jgi:hypothetical protein
MPAGIDREIGILLETRFDERVDELRPVLPRTGVRHGRRRGGFGLFARTRGEDCNAHYDEQTNTHGGTPAEAKRRIVMDDASRGSTARRSGRREPSGEVDHRGVRMTPFPQIAFENDDIAVRNVASTPRAGLAARDPCGKARNTRASGPIRRK